MESHAPSPKEASEQQQSHQPGLQQPMHPQPVTSGTETVRFRESAQLLSYTAAGKLKEKVAVITGGDSGIGRAVAVCFAKEGAHVVIACLAKEEEDAMETKRLIDEEKRTCFALAGDIGNEAVCKQICARVALEFGRIDILVNNAGEQYVVERPEDFDLGQIEHTFRTNTFSMFSMVKHALPHMQPGSCIINTTSVTAYRGSPTLIPYSSTKGAIVSFTRSLAVNLAPRGIRVNAVAPGPIWTPLIVASFSKANLETWAEGHVPLGRIGQPSEVAPCFVFLACGDSSYITGQVLHPNGGQIING